ncbi:hypothetical protein F5Y06DRAFT_261287 [Hypoxylon sp. FL0890]|nr:hypothetical protein F5Y06DRAFT_261287 [Hypoxylon sp. FL0890]
MKSTSARIPTPPPLPPLSEARHGDQKPPQDPANSKDTGDNVSGTTTAYSAPLRFFTPTVYFFYGTLTKPEVLKQVLDLNHEPEMRSAMITGYSLTKWGDYNALIDGKPGEEVTGMAFEVYLPEHEYKLAHYETNAYQLVSCCIDYTDGEDPAQVLGRTFKYAGDAAALKEGRFDRKLWESRMGSRLPEKWNGKRGLEGDA